MIKHYPLLRSLLIYREMPYRFTLNTVLFLLASAGLALQQWLVGRALNEVNAGQAVNVMSGGGLDASRAWHWFWLLLAVAALRGVAQYLAAALSMVLSQGLLTLLRERILQQVQSLHLGYHWQHGMGEMVTRTTRDADKLRDALINFWRQLVETPLVLLAAFGLLTWYAPLLGVVPLLLTIGGLALFVRQTEHLLELDREVGAAYDRVNQDLSEGIGGVRVIKSFALEAGRIERFTDQVGFFAERARLALAYASSRISLPQIIVALSHVWVFAYGALLVRDGGLDIGEWVTSLLIVTTLIFRIEGIGRVMQVFADARSSAERIWQLLDTSTSIHDGNGSLPQGPLGLRLDAVSVDAPGGGQSILNDCSATLEPGEVVALVGATGTGKSLLASLLPRLTDADRGAVLVGSSEHGWRDVRDVGLAELRRRVHVVPQESFLFSDTLAANLRLGAADASEQDLLWGLRMASAQDVLERLPNGLQTTLGDRGVTLSGGQRQRINLARALLSKPYILCLDDATSALDAISESAVLNNIRTLHATLGHPVTVLVISSKLSTVLLADRVLLLDKGHIADSGRHAELAERNPAYRELLGI